MTTTTGVTSSAPDSAPESESVSVPSVPDGAFFAHCHPEIPTCAHQERIRRQQWELWNELKPELDGDFDDIITHLVLITGESATFATDAVLSLHRLDELPLLNAHQRHFCWLDFSRLIAIDKALDKFGTPTKEILAAVDKELVAFFTPTKPNQAFPTRAQLRRKLRELLKSLDDSLPSDDEPIKDTYRVDEDGNGRGRVEVATDVETLAVIDTTVRTLAAKENIPFAKAAIKLLTGTATPQATVVVNLYSPDNVPGMASYSPELGWVSPDYADSLQQRAVSVRDMTSAGSRTAEAYSPPADIAAFVRGRDGTCRWPGCSVPAAKCQLDHRINHAEGGPTTAANLVCLCQHHHNVKTDTRAFYIMDPLTGDIYWLLGDNTWATTTATGPLHARASRWALTVGQVMDIRRKNARERALILAEQLKNDQEALDETRQGNTPIIRSLVPNGPTRRDDGWWVPPKTIHLDNYSDSTDSPPDYELREDHSDFTDRDPNYPSAQAADTTRPGHKNRHRRRRVPRPSSWSRQKKRRHPNHRDPRVMTPHQAKRRAHKIRQDRRRGRLED